MAFTSSHELREKARTELNEHEDTIPAQLEKFRKLVEEIDRFSCPVNDEFLLRFLRARKFNLEKAVKLLRQYYGMRANNPELFRDLTPLSLDGVLERRLQIVLRSRDAHGRNIFIFRAGSWDPSEVSLDSIFRSNYLYLEEMTSSLETQINGIIAIVDFDGFSFFQARQFTPKHALRMVKILQDSFPCRFQEFHLVNQPFVFSLVYSIVRPFLSEKIRNRIHIHGQDLSSMHDFVEPTILPDFLGGQNRLWEDDWTAFHKKMLAKEDYYQDMCHFGFQTETLRSHQI